MILRLKSTLNDSFWTLGQKSSYDQKGKKVETVKEIILQGGFEGEEILSFLNSQFVALAV